MAKCRHPETCNFHSTSYEAKTAAKTQASRELSDIILVLRDKSREYNLDFLSYLLEMAFLEALKQSDKTPTTDDLYISETNVYRSYMQKMKPNT